MTRLCSGDGSMRKNETIAVRLVDPTTLTAMPERVGKIEGRWATFSQLGFTLLEISIALTISMILIVAGVWAKVNALREERAQIQGDAMVTLSNSVSTYMTNNYTALVNSTAIGGFAVPTTPTIAELITAGLLSNNFNPTNIYSSGYQIAISRVPTGCVAPACDLVSLINLSGPIIDYRTGRVDGPSLGAAANRIGANGGWSNLVNAALISGQDGTWNATNPVVVAGVPVAGILGVRGGYGSSGWAQFLRRDGTLPMTGNLNMGTQSINNANAVNSVTLATTSGATVGGTLNVAGATTTNGITNNGDINTTTLATTAGATIGGTLNVAGATTTNGITNNGNITNTGDVLTARLYLSTVVSTGASCVGLDGYQARTSSGQVASCVSGTWTIPSGGGASTPCSSQVVGAWSSTGGTNGVCQGTASGTTSGTTVTVTASSGGTGSAQYLCTNGTWSWQSGTCVAPACSATTVGPWGGSCYGVTSATSSGSTITVTANSGGTGSAQYKCNSGTWSWQSGTCALAACTASTQTWGAGCSGTTTATPSGSTSSVVATTGTGTATYLCTAGSWSYQSGPCTMPLACNGTASWGNGNCSSTYSIPHGSNTTLSSTTTNTLGGQNLGGSTTGSAMASCNNGSLTLTSKSCVYNGSNPKAYNVNGGGPAPLTVSIASAAAGNYCQSMLGSGTTMSISTVRATPADNNTWFTWAGRTADMGWSAMTAGNGCTTDGCSVWAFYTYRGGAYPYLVTSLTCTNNN